VAPAGENHAMSRRENPNGNRRIAWQNVLTVFSAAILIGAEVFGAAFAGGWAVASYLDLGPYGVHIMQGIFFACGIAVMVAFIRNARRVEPFTTRGCRRSHAPRCSPCASARRDRRARTKKILVKRVNIAYVRNCPISHVPVAVCRSVGIRTRGRTAARSKIAKTKVARPEVCGRLQLRYT